MRLYNQTVLNLIPITANILFFQGELNVKARHLVKGGGGVEEGREVQTGKERQNVKGILRAFTFELKT